MQEENIPRIREWLEEYSDVLTREIESVEIMEERNFSWGHYGILRVSPEADLQRVTYDAGDFAVVRFFEVLPH